ncbi:MAG: prenyltransferase [Pseudomonadota bacterium]
MIFVPLLLGQLFALAVHNRFSWHAFVLTHLFGMLYQVYLLYTNDHADEVTDKSNQQFFLSGGSRVLPQGKLRANNLLLGARVVLVSLVLLTGVVALYHDRPWLPAGLLGAVALCWAYNRKPLQLSYRGHGEVLQGLGCGVVLPLIGYYMQNGSLHGFPWWTLLPLFLVFYAGNIITALPDFCSDQTSRKNTIPVRYGQQSARYLAVLLLAMAYVSLVGVEPAIGSGARASIVLPSLFVLLVVVGSGFIRTADVSNFLRCKAFVAAISASQAWFLCAWCGALLVQTLG